MKIFDRFLVRSFLGPLFLTIFIVLFVLVLQFLWVYIDELVGKGLGLKVILEFLFWGTCTVIPMALPLATLLASIMTMGNLGEFNELLAMKAAGIPLQRIMRPLIILSIIISVAAFLAANNLMPLAHKNIFALRDDISRTKEEIRIPTGIFYNGIDNYSLRVEKRDNNTDMLYDVMVYNHSSNRGNNNVTLADSGAVRLTEDKKNIIFTLFSGETYEEGERKSSSDTSFAMQRIKFDKQDIIIELNNYAFQRRDGDRFGSDVMAQGLSSLGHRRDSLDSLYSIARTQFLKRLLVAGGLNYSRQLDTANKQHFREIFPIDQLPVPEENPQYPDLLNRAIGKVDQMSNQVDNFMIEEVQIHLPLRRTNVEWYRKFTVAFACFIFFFIGAPLGAIIRKGGLGTPVIVSMLFFVVYYVIDISGKKLATDGSISAAMGTLVSAFVLLPIGVFLTYKATTDSALFNKDAYLALINKLKKHFPLRHDKDKRQA
ncbi:MAG: LptF/LptG family permease [Bacteroidales bacterium]|nr:LptF/LptG family permease [Bacteroidales bacterium]MDD2263622.1 LptF/LptG family permease [Bacteroidales bacterium]MDD2830587.1 LptF/LptG family permease [Bacteroidales bacterium]MDD3208856.1 LptF/LptG family permease [Bacteroidales bacterium]MDD3697419.1 LptF/LptG family permease [Bacteroidales bacterium]